MPIDEDGETNDELLEIDKASNTFGKSNPKQSKNVAEVRRARGEA